METIKVNVLLSVYKPNLAYLREQLRSIDEQDYENIELLVFDDCVSERTDVSVFEETMGRKPWRMIPYETENLGYVKAFERLVQYADGEYCVFCDQDDVWMPEKVSTCLSHMQQNSLLLVSTDKQIIDGDGSVLVPSYDATREKPFQLPKTPAEIGKSNFFGTFADGMCLMAETAFAKRCVPFSKDTGHDKWLIACACAEDAFDNIGTPLVQHRRHGENVSGFMKGIETKADYRRERVLPNDRVISQFAEKYPDCPYLPEVRAFSEARIKHRFFSLLRYRSISPKIAAFEMMLCMAPEGLFSFAMRCLRKRYGKY